MSTTFWCQAIGLALIALGTGPACLMVSWRSLDAVAESYVRTALQLAQHDPSLVEDWRGPESWRPGARLPIAALQPEIERLMHDLERAAMDVGSAQEYARVHYLTGQVRALRFAAERLAGRSTSVDEQAREEFGVNFSPLDAGAVARAQARLNALLPGDRPLHERVATLRRNTIVPADRREEMVRTTGTACMQAVGAVAGHLMHEGVHVTFRNDLQWDAFARYNGSSDNRQTTIEIRDGPLDVTRAMRLACHEGFGGHHTQHVRIDELAVKRGWLELQLTPGFGPHLLMTEGAAEVAADLTLTRQERETLLRDQLLPLAGLDTTLAATIVDVDAQLIELLPVVTDVARRYLDGTLTRERAVARLADEALLTNPEGTLTFIERRRARALVYGEGRRAVYAAMKTKDLAGLFAAFKTVAAVQ